MGFWCGTSKAIVVFVTEIGATSRFRRCGYVGIEKIPERDTDNVRLPCRIGVWPPVVGIPTANSPSTIVFQMKLVRVIRAPCRVEGEAVADRVEVVMNDTMIRALTPLSSHLRALFFTQRSTNERWSKTQLRGWTVEIGGWYHFGAV